MTIFKTNNKGDTIVEVLIAMAVVSLVLVGAYVSSNKSSQSIRTAQERGEALKIAETQVEQLKIEVAKGTALTPTFCFNAGGNLVTPGPTCTFTSGIDYTAAITKAVPDYTVKVTWDALAGGKNNVELDYKAP